MNMNKQELTRYQYEIVEIFYEWHERCPNMSRTNEWEPSQSRDLNNSRKITCMDVLSVVNFSKLIYALLNE